MTKLPPDSFGARLRLARVRRGMSQGDLSRRIGVDPSYISQIETGRREPSLANLRRIAQAVDASADYLLGLDTMKKGTLAERKRAVLQKIEAALR